MNRLERLLILLVIPPAALLVASFLTFQVFAIVAALYSISIYLFHGEMLEWINRGEQPGNGNDEDHGVGFGGPSDDDLKIG